MALLDKLYLFALKQMLPGAAGAIVGEFGGEIVEAVGSFLEKRLKDDSRRVTAALESANERAWKTLEIALAGESLWNLFDPAEDRALRQQIREFLDALPPGQLPAEGDVFRRQALDELRAARRAGALAGSPDLVQIARGTARFARYTDPRQVVEADAQVVRGLADDLTTQGYAALGRVLSVRADAGQSLLTISVSYFFRRAVEEDDKLRHSLAWATWDRLAAAQELGFARLREAMTEHGRELELRLSELLIQVRQIHGVVLDIRAEQQAQGDRHRELYEAVLDLHRRMDRQAGADVSVRDDEERQLLRAVLERYRALPAEQRRQLPVLLHAVAELQMRSGEVDEAAKSYAQAEIYVSDRAALAESHYHAYRAALGRRDWIKALASYRQAASLDPATWTRPRLEAELNEVMPGLSPGDRSFLQQALAQWKR